MKCCNCVVAIKVISEANFLAVSMCREILIHNHHVVEGPISFHKKCKETLNGQSTNMTNQ